MSEPEVVIELDAVEKSFGATPVLRGTSLRIVAGETFTILGGSAGNLDTTDTDYFDDGVIAHEFGHFVEFNMSASRWMARARSSPESLLKSTPST